MHLERLRLAGFKSFVDATELAVEPGLTGIVGPNGCGKSNLVDALSWVMGEASARRLRGGEMDDVIFAGSASRPGRNIAEVTLTIDNSARGAPFAFNDRDAIEVVRRIERGGGSLYRINGREVRARDVQLLFADAATGPHSGGIVTQGRVGALIAAKPSERRALLDEAAGTAGLHARRHEAELKLKAAEDNLLRLDDVLTTMQAQLDGLKKQARQAERYRRLAEQIRQAESQLLASRWRAAAAESEMLGAALRDAERAVAAATETAVGAERERAAAEAALPDLRLAEASASAVVQRLTLARAALDEEAKRLETARAEAERRLQQLSADLAREDENLADIATALARLAAERRGLEQGDGNDAARQRDVAARLDAAAADLARAETGLQQMTEACASGEARRAVLERQRRDLAERRSRVETRRAEDERQRAALLAAAAPSEAVAAAARDAIDAAAQIEVCRAVAVAAGEALAAAQVTETGLVDRARETDRVLSRLRAEAEALASLLPDEPTADAAGTWPTVLSQVRVPAGFEAATAALFDGELTTPIAPRGAFGEACSAGWIEFGALTEAPALPAGATPLTSEIEAPAVLVRRLGQTGLVADEDSGWGLQPHLRAGQSLVDRDGRLWRWDGFVRLTAGRTGLAEQLRQRNRIDALSDEIGGAAEAASRAAEQAGTARAARVDAAERERRAVAALRAAEDRLARARAAEADATRRSLAAEARLAALSDAIDKLGVEAGEIAAHSAEVERSLSMLPAAALARAGLESARAQAAAARRQEAEARAALDRLAQEAASRQRRLQVIDGEEASWRRRHEGAQGHRATLVERRQALAAEIAAMTVRPTAIAADSKALAERITTAAAERRAAGDALAVGETRLRETGDRARRAEQALAAAREQRGRAEARRESMTQTVERLRAEIGERLGLAPDDLDLVEAAEPAVVTTRLERLLREREAIGPVNLVAETEAAEVGARIDGLTRERAELTEAIARLRRGIGALDQEGRKRLLDAFERLNGHFGELFARLFGGGKAHLALADDGDPLEAGLEIIASPPGKRLQSMTLLSGGEQALSALALIFAVFLTNPAPICVLDEVDAPLDDANVDRFCRLVADIADTTGTRFLLVTHHRITMARMDRLFGVTMPERGVSQLVSVDLARAAELRKTA